MQEHNRSSSHFSQRTENLSAKLGLLLRDLPAIIGISARMFYGYRSGKYPLTEKAWRKLESAEKTAEFNTEKTVIGDKTANYTTDLNEFPNQNEDFSAFELPQIRIQLAEHAKQLRRIDISLRSHNLKDRMAAAGAWPPDEADLRLPLAEIIRKYPPPP